MLHAMLSKAPGVRVLVVSEGDNHLVTPVAAAWVVGVVRGGGARSYG